MTSDATPTSKLLRIKILWIGLCLLTVLSMICIGLWWKSSSDGEEPVQTVSEELRKIRAEPSKAREILFGLRKVCDKSSDPDRTAYLIVQGYQPGLEKEFIRESCYYEDVKLTSGGSLIRSFDVLGSDGRKISLMRWLDGNLELSEKYEAAWLRLAPELELKTQVGGDVYFVKRE